MEKIKRNLKQGISFFDSTLFSVVAVAVIAFGTSFGRILNFPSAMNVAVAALSGANVIPAFIGSLLAYILTGQLEGGIVQLCSILVIAAVHYINPFGLKKDDPVYLSLVTTGAMMLFGCVMSVAVPSDTYTASLRMISALMCGCVVFIARTIAATKSKSGVYDLTGVNGIFVSIIYIMSISTLTAIPLSVLNLGRILGTSVLLIAVRKYKNIGGAVVGSLTTCGVLLCIPSLSRNTLILATSGLICGAFLQFGTLLMVLVFLIVSLVSLIAIGVNGDTYHMFADLVAGTMLFIACPLPVVKKIAKKAVGVKNSLDIVGQTTSSKLSFASNTLGGIRQQLSMVTSAMDKRYAKTSLANDIKRCVCEDCPAYELCFGKSDRTMIGLTQLEKTVVKYNSVSEDDVARCLKCCTNQKLMCSAFNELYSKLLSEKAENVRIREMREFLTEQLSSMEDMLNDLSFRTSQVRSIDSNLSAQVRDYFCNLGYANAKVAVYVDENLCQRCDVFLTAEFMGDLVKITTAVSSITDCDMDIPSVVREDNLTRISFSEIPAFTVETSSFSASASGEYSGDSFDILELSSCEKYIILSDGMGTGKRARLDSVFSVSLISRLIRSGMAMTTAHKLINSMLRVKGWEESFATLDLLKIDVSSASAELLKAGAPVSWLCRDGNVKAVGGQAFPAGILADCVPDVCSLKLFDGDIVVMTSDGVDERLAEKICRIAVKENDKKLDEIVAEMGRNVLSKRDEKNCDDVTIIALKVNKRN